MILTTTLGLEGQTFHHMGPPAQPATLTAIGTADSAA